MNIKSSGYVFLMTLCIIMVISLLGVTMMRHVVLYYKVAHRREDQHRAFYQLEHLALDLAGRKPSTPKNECMVLADNANEMILKLKKNEGCSVLIKGREYHYFIEDLGDYACMMVRKEERLYATHHRRVSIMLVSNEVPNSLLQIRYITSIPLQSCYGTVQYVDLGVSSWRYFASV